MLIMIWLIFSAITLGLGLSLGVEAAHKAIAAGYVPKYKTPLIERVIAFLRLFLLCYCPLLNLYVFYLFVFHYEIVIDESVKRIKEKVKSE